MPTASRTLAPLLLGVSLGLCACLEPVDFTGKTCESQCPLPWSCVAHLCQPSGSGGGDGGSPSTDAGFGPAQMLSAFVQVDTDDAEYTGLADPPDNEVLWQENSWDEVGLDGMTHVAAAYRFVLDVPKGSRIDSASLELYTLVGSMIGTAVEVDVQAWLSTGVPAFGLHSHGAVAHGGPLTASVSGWGVQEYAASLSPELATLVQPVVDQPGWASGNILGLYVSASAATTWVAFEDTHSGGGHPARLRVTYRAPVTP